MPFVLVLLTVLVCTWCWIVCSDSTPQLVAADSRQTASEFARGSCTVFSETQLLSEASYAAFSPKRRVTEIYSPHFPTNRIDRFDLDSLGVYSQVSIGVSAGVVCLVADVDRDGGLEVFVYKGENGNGILRVYSSPQYSLVDSLIFPGQTVVPSSVAVNVDSDSLLEVFLSPADLNGDERAVLIDYYPTTHTFSTLADVSSFPGASGITAMADFDGDSNTEFVRAGAVGYGVFEWDSDTLRLTGVTPDSDYGGYIVACRPKPGGIWHLLVGHSSSSSGFQFDLLAPMPNDKFRLVHRFADSTGYFGAAPCFAADIDCDGLDELVLGAYPMYQVWEWDVGTQQFVFACSYDGTTLGGLYYWFVSDVDLNGLLEWSNISGGSTFRTLSSFACHNCNENAYCAFPPPVCACACHPDPNCDGVISDVADVVRVVDVAFRGAQEEIDPAPLCGKILTDVNCSSATDVADVIKVVNVAFRGAYASQEYCDACITVQR